MTTVTRPADATTRPLSRPRRLLVAVLCGFLLPLALMARTAPPAAALLPPVPLLAGAAGAAPPVQAATVACAASVVCLGVTGAVMLGVTAYATKDTWMPIVEGLFNANRPSSVPFGTPSGCLATKTPQESGFDYNVSPGGNISYTMINPYVICGIAFDTSLGFNANLRYNRVCKNVSTDAFVTSSNANVQIARWSASAGAPGAPAVGNFQVPPCASGQYIDTLGIQIYFARGTDSGGTLGRSIADVIQLARPDASAEQTVNVDCKRPDGTSFARSTTTRGVEALNRITVPSCSDTANGGTQGATPTKIDIAANDTPTLTWTPPDWGVEYPNCFAPTGLLCQIVVKLDNQPCTSGAWLCRQWFNNTANPRLGCFFGTYRVDWSNCTLLKRHYQPDFDPNAQPGPNGFPQPDAEPNPDPEPEPSPSPTTSPNPNPTPTPTPTTPPTTDPTPSPTDPGGNPDPADGSGSCLGDGFTWNPVSWVYTPVKCALMWAFVPKTSLSERISRIRNVYAGVIPFAWFGVFADIPAVVNSDCPDWRIKVDASYGKDVDKNVVCDSGFTHSIRAARPWLASGMLLLAFWPLIRGLVFASVPILKPTPTDGGQR